MRITFVSRHYDLREAQKSFIENKIKTIKKRYFDKRMDVQVELASEKNRQRCELNVRSDGFQELFRSEHNDMQQSIIDALDKLELMLRKRHDKMVTRKQRIQKRDMLGIMPDLSTENEMKADSDNAEPEGIGEI